MPLGNVTQAVPIPPPALEPIGNTMPGLWLIIIVFLLGTIILILVVAYIAVMIWGGPMLKAKTSRLSGDAIIEHFETGKNGRIMTAPVEGHAIVHREVKDGTMISLHQGISNLDGHQVAVSWGLFGVTIPIFLLAGITKLKSLGYNTRDEVLEEIGVNEGLKAANLIDGGYNFDNFEDILIKTKSPVFFPLEVEHVSDFVQNVDQHATEGDVSDELEAYAISNEDDFGKIMFQTAIAVLIIAIAMWLMLGGTGGK